MRGEVEESLDYLKTTGCRLVLGLRDIMDEPSRLIEEWTRKNAFAAVEDRYDDIWIYGLPEICDPLEGIGVSQSVRDKAVFTGYLPRADEPSGALYDPILIEEDPYVLVTTGGGGDGARLVDWVLKAYESDPTIAPRAKIVLGPFMETGYAADFQTRAAQLDKVDLITFVASIEPLIEQAVGLVAMGGYNTFCEILSFDKRAVIVPRRQPRLEQFIRASRAEELGLLTMLCDDEAHDPAVMARAIKALPSQQKPQSTEIPGLLGGVDTIRRLVDQALAEGRTRRSDRTDRLAEGGFRAPRTAAS